jgi:DNA-binding LacI/PurR family transcriptional regulator
MEYTLADHPHLPKYWKLAERLRAQMRSGELTPGSRLPTVSEMQALHNVSLTTVDRAYSMLAKEGLIVGKRGSGTFVAHPPERLKSAVLGVYFHLGIDQHPFYSRIWRGIREVAERANRDLLLLHDQAPASWEKVDGLLLCEDKSGTVRWQTPFLMPRVSLLNPLPETSTVEIADADGLKQAVEHLVELGHRRIAMLSFARPDNTYLPLQRRYAGYVNALANAGIALETTWIRSLNRTGEKYRSFSALGYERMSEWLRDGWEQTGCTAILTHNDDSALGILKALREAGLRVPEDVSVVGFDGTEVAEYSNPTLTTIEVPLEQVGALGTELLLAQIDGDSEIKPLIKILPLRLKRGQSTAPPRA